MHRVQTPQSCLFNGHAFLAPLHWIVDVGIGYIPKANLDFRSRRVHDASCDDQICGACLLMRGSNHRRGESYETRHSVPYAE